ncbi:MAG: hypothetical protein ACRCZO_03430 [Cetobacterium sp.]
MEKRYFIGTLGAFIGGLLIWISITIYFDPSQQFRITNYPHGDERILNVGLAKNGEYNTVIFGSSTSQNILKKDVDKLYNDSSINISLSGTTSYEQRKLLKIALENKPKRVIYGLDHFVYNRGYIESRVALEKFAYENSTSQFYRYFFNFSTFKGVIKGIVKKGLGRADSHWIDTYGYWGDNFKYSKESTLSFDKETQWGAQNSAVLNQFQNGYSLELMKKNFDAFYELLKDNENTEFLIYYPPYANLWWNYAREYGCEETILKFKKYISYKIIDLKNVKLYDFQDEQDIITNLDNYKDMVHFSPLISKKIIKNIRRDKNRINLEAL